jgi:hypothetical protein
MRQAPAASFRRLNVQAIFDLLGELPTGEWTAEAAARWQALSDEAIGGDRLFTADIGDAATFLLPGWTIAMQRRDYPAAAALLRRFFEHPAASQADRVDRIEFSSRLATSLLAAGEEGEGLGIHWGLLAAERAADVRLSLLVMRGLLQEFCREEKPPAELASPGLTDMVEEVVRRLRRWRPRWRRLPARASYAELSSHLARSYPR